MNRPRHPLSATGQQGFTLMESLVAVMILGVALVTVMQLFAGGLRSARASADYTRAVFLAREKLEETILTSPLTETTLAGDLDPGQKWECRITPITDETDTQTTSQTQGPSPWRVSCTIYWLANNRTKEYTLETVRLGKMAEE